VKKADFAAIAETLNRASVRFLVVGGIAVVEHGYGRNTYDVDLVIELSPEPVARAFTALAEIGYHPTVPISAAQFSTSEQRQALMKEKGMTVLNFFSSQHPQTPLDIFVTEPFNFENEFAAAGERAVSAGVNVRIVSLGALLQMKKTAGRGKDLADIDELSLLHGLPSSYDRAE
jgi:predicted nucleotidyltransferase